MRLQHLTGLFLTVLALLTATPGHARDWRTTVEMTPEGGYLIGNPDAPVKVIEYFSLTCSHCRTFATDVQPQLEADYVASGKANLELRNFVLNPADLAASLLMRCGTAVSAVQLYRKAFADQRTLFSGLGRITAEEATKISSTPLAARPGMLATTIGIDRWFQGQGLAAGRAQSCLKDPERQQDLVSLRVQGAQKYGIDGTPTLIVNGSVVPGHDWNALETAVKAALKGQ